MYMNNQLAIISHPEFGEVRNVMIKGEPWFVAKDVCEILGHTNPSMAIGLLDEDERGKKSLGRQGEAWVINESGLYALIMRSNKPKAKQFRKWVTSEVLPSIRKFGFYVHPSAELTKRQQKMLGKAMRATVEKYTTKDDIRKTARKMCVSARYVERVLGGFSENRDIMLELQKRAMRNKLEWDDAYNPDRMKRVLEVLDGEGLAGAAASGDDRPSKAKACEEYWQPLRYKIHHNQSGWINPAPGTGGAEAPSASSMQHNTQEQDAGMGDQKTEDQQFSENPWLTFASVVRNGSIQDQIQMLEQMFQCRTAECLILGIREITRNQFLQHAQYFLASRGVALGKEVQTAYLRS